MKSASAFDEMRSLIPGEIRFSGVTHSLDLPVKLTSTRAQRERPSLIKNNYNLSENRQ
jgi:hypothetical protein